MRKIISTAFIALIGANSATAGVPVTVLADVPGQIAQVVNYAQMLKDFETMVRHLQTAERELESISGSRGLANSIDSVYDATVAVDKAAVLAGENIKTGEDLGLEGQEAEVYNKGNENAAVYLGQSDKSLEQTKNRYTELVRLIAKVNDSPDQKDILDLQARISAELAMLQNEQAKVELLKSKSEAAQAVQERRIQQMAIESSGEPRNIW